MCYFSMRSLRFSPHVSPLTAPRFVRAGTPWVAVQAGGAAAHGGVYILLQPRAPEAAGVSCGR